MSHAATHRQVCAPAIPAKPRDGDGPNGDTLHIHPCRVGEPIGGRDIVANVPRKRTAPWSSDEAGGRDQAGGAVSGRAGVVVERERVVAEVAYRYVRLRHVHGLLFERSSSVPKEDHGSTVNQNT